MTWRDALSDEIEQYVRNMFPVTVCQLPYGSDIKILCDLLHSEIDETLVSSLTVAEGTKDSVKWTFLNELNDLCDLLAVNILDF
jgi:hypothetical protein